MPLSISWTCTWPPPRPGWEPQRPRPGPLGLPTGAENPETEHTQWTGYYWLIPVIRPLDN